MIKIRITDHAQNRLKERFNFFNLADVNAIKTALFTKGHYTTVKINDDLTCIRQIRFKGKDIQAVIDPLNKIVITITPANLVIDSDYSGFDKMVDRFNELKDNFKPIEIKKDPKYKTLFLVGRFFIGVFPKAL